MKFLQNEAIHAKHELLVRVSFIGFSPPHFRPRERTHKSALLRLVTSRESSAPTLDTLLDNTCAHASSCTEAPPAWSSSVRSIDMLIRIMDMAAQPASSRESGASPGANARRKTIYGGTYKLQQRRIRYSVCKALYHVAYCIHRPVSPCSCASSLYIPSLYGQSRAAVGSSAQQNEPYCPTPSCAPNNEHAKPAPAPKSTFPRFGFQGLGSKNRNDKK